MKYSKECHKVMDYIIQFLDGKHARPIEEVQEILLPHNLPTSIVKALKKTGEEELFDIAFLACALLLHPKPFKCKKDDTPTEANRVRMQNIHMAYSTEWLVRSNIILMAGDKWTKEELLLTDTSKSKVSWKANVKKGSYKKTKEQIKWTPNIPIDESLFK